jgi:hypothetical protein
LSENETDGHEDAQHVHDFVLHAQRAILSGNSGRSLRFEGIFYFTYYRSNFFYYRSNFFFEFPFHLHIIFSSLIPIPISLLSIPIECTSIASNQSEPPNQTVTGAFSSDASIWDNEDDENPFKCQDEKSPEVWKELCLRYKATIIDFGFARALTPVDLDDVSHEESSSQERHPNKENAGYQNVGRDQQISKAQKQKKALERGSNGNSGPLRNLFRNLSKTSLVSLNEMDDSVHSLASVSHKMKRVMSTLGNRNYAAPEIVNKVREFSAQDKKKETQKDIQQKKTASETTKTISEFVADYGVLVDSYSMGHTIRYMMTGVMPGVSVEDTIKKQQRAGRAKKVFSKLGMSKKKKAAAGKGPRKPRYRSLYDLPGQLFLLVERLTEVSPYNRMSIRNARRTVPWVRDVLSFQEQPKNIHDGLDGPTDTGTPTEALQELSLEYVSEEQLHSLRETRYLPLATTTPGSIVSIHGSRRSIGGATAYTVQTTEESIHDFQLDNSSDSSNNPAAEGVGLEDDILTF